MARREGFASERSSRWQPSGAWPQPPTLRFAGKRSLPSASPAELAREAGFSRLQEAPETRDFGHLAQIAWRPFEAKGSRVPPPVPPLCARASHARASTSRPRRCRATQGLCGLISARNSTAARLSARCSRAGTQHGWARYRGHRRLRDTRGTPDPPGRPGRFRSRSSRRDKLFSH
jgi:hypothetical protein